MKKMLRGLITCTTLLVPLTIAHAAEPELKTLRVNGYDMPYAEQGSGPPLILIHGALGDHRSWSSVMAPLAKHFRVIAPVSRYYAKGEWDPKWPSFHRGMLADDHAEFIRQLGQGPVHLAGWSQGSVVAHLVALRNPGLVRSAYLFEGAAKLARSPEDAAALGKVMAPLMKSILVPMKEKGPKAVTPKFIDIVAGEEGAFAKMPPQLQERVLDNARVLPLFLSRLADKAQPVVSCEMISKSKVPTQFVVGTDTAPIFNSMFAAYEPCFGEKRIERVEGATHMWPGSDPAAFADSLARFAQGH